VQDKIRRWIKDHENEMIADIAALVRHPSVSKYNPSSKKSYGEACAAALDEMLALGKKYGFDTANADYQCGVIKYGNGQKSIGFWGHLDVVPAGDDWIYAPYACTQKGDFLIGRGVDDNKGASVVCLYVMRCLKELAVPLRHTLQLITGCAEETGMQDAVYYVSHYSVPDCNIVADAHFPVCFGEKGIIEAELRTPALSDAVIDFHAGTVSNSVPDRAQITLKTSEGIKAKLASLPEGVSAEAGDVLTVVTATGVAKHAAMPEGGVNAVHVLLDALTKLDMLCKDDLAALAFMRTVCATTDGSALGIACSDDLSGALTCVGSTVTFKDHRADLGINIRYPITADADRLERHIEEAAGAAGYALSAIDNNRPNHVDRDSVFVKTLNRVYNEVMGCDEDSYTMGGGTYARKIPNAVAFGAGMPVDKSALDLPTGHGDVHAPDEVVSIPMLQKAMEIYILSVLELDKAD
jgi:succinyl-diaminopimelate desuccinylase